MLMVIRSVHTAIYIILAASVCLLLFAAITAYSGPLVIAAAMAVAVEVVVFTANGFECPLTGLARKYGAEEGAKGTVISLALPDLTSIGATAQAHPSSLGLHLRYCCFGVGGGAMRDLGNTIYWFGCVVAATVLGIGVADY